MDADKSKTVSVPLDVETARKLAHLFRRGLEGVGKVADACNNVDSRARMSLSEACNNIDAQNLRVLADACNNIDSRNLKALADACNNIDAHHLKAVSDACNNIDIRHLAESLGPLNQHLNQISDRFESAAKGA